MRDAYAWHMSSISTCHKEKVCHMSSVFLPYVWNIARTYVKQVCLKNSHDTRLARGYRSSSTWIACDYDMPGTQMFGIALA